MTVDEQVRKALDTAGNFQTPGTVPIERILHAGRRKKGGRRALGVVGIAAAVSMVGAVAMSIPDTDQSGAPVSRRSEPSAADLCRSALGREADVAIPTTVGTIREWGTGLAGEYPGQEPLAEFDAGEPAVWCLYYSQSLWKTVGVGPRGIIVPFPDIEGRESDVPTAPPAYR